ncbi:hypothetical protein [Methylobacterium nodulans]|uniref:hypothetical protein n=1 Tax=Methylobacterium nodulans TaxID=114616 RepID=UPI000A02FE87
MTHIRDPGVERAILGPALAEKPHADALVALVWRQRVDDVFLDRYPKLRGVIWYGAGYDNIDLDAVRAALSHLASKARFDAVRGDLGVR